MKITFNPSTVAALTTPPNNKDITFDLRGRNIFARGVKFYGTDTNTWRDIKINNVSIGSHTLDLRNGSNTTLTNTNGIVTINSTWRPVVDNLTSDSTTSSLSAKQGKVLKALIDGKSNSDHNHDDRYLKLTGGTMASNALITFADSDSWDTGKGPQGARGGLYWSGQSDYVKLYAEETVGDNLDLVIQFGDDNSNGLSIRDATNTPTSYISSSGVITTGTFKGNLDWSYITNKPATATRWPSWAEVTGKPSAFNPADHTHTVFKNNLMIKGTNGISDSASIHLGIGDYDTGFKWISDGVCQIYANSAAVGQWTSGGMNWFVNPTVNGNKVWNAGNDGSGSGLDADTVDGYHENSFLRCRGATETNQEATLWSQVGIKEYCGALPDGLTDTYNYGGVISLPGTHSRFEFYASHQSSSGDGLYYRSGWDSDKKPWFRLIDSLTIGYQSVANTQHLRINYANTWSTWYWAGQNGQPSWLWGSNDGTNMYVWNPSNFNVNTAQYLRSLGNQNCQTGRTQAYGDVYSYNTYDGNTGSPTTYSSVIGFGRGTAGTVEIAGGWCNTHLYWRSLRDCCEDWFPWRTVLDSSNYTEFINNYYWANVKISASSSTTTSPTVHTLTATRVCAGHNPEIDNSISCSNWFRSSGNTGWYNTTYKGGWYMSDTSWIRAHNGVGIYTSGQIYSSSSIRMSNILLERTDEINNSANGDIRLNYRNSGNVSLCYGGGTVGIGTNTPSYKLDVNGQMRASGFHHASVNSDDYMLLAGGGYKSFGGDANTPIFLGCFDLYRGGDGTISSSFHCLGYSVPFTYTRGGNYCEIVIPDTARLSFFILAAIASVNYSGGGMDAWVGDHRGEGAWWLHCQTYTFNKVRVKGFHLANKNNDSWWGGNPLYSGIGGANKITVCIFGYATYR